MGEQFALPGSKPIPPKPVVSRTADISVRTTDRGLPTQLKIGASEMSRAPDDLAHEILSLCQLSALRQQVAHRRELLARGVTSAVIRGLNLATEEDLAEAAKTVRGDDDGPPETWMTSR